MMMRTVIACVAVACTLYSLLDIINSIQMSRGGGGMDTHTMSPCEEKVYDVVKEGALGDAFLTFLQSASCLVAAYLLFMMPRYTTYGYALIGSSMVIGLIYSVWRFVALMNVTREMCGTEK